MNNMIKIVIRRVYIGIREKEIKEVRDGNQWRDLCKDLGDIVESS